MRYSRVAIKEHFNIVEYISRYVSLKRSGRNYVGLCPFHKEKTASFSVSEEKQIFHCFGCGVGGNLVDFLEKYLKLDTYDVLTLLENERGIKLIERNGEVEKKKNFIDRLLKINKKAADFFSNNLFRTREGADALTYLKNRKISIDTVKKFNIGFGGKGWDNLSKILLQTGFSQEEIKATGLVVFSEKGARDFFRNRVTFPIINQREEIIAFGGRILDNSLPKYVNSQESIIFSKRKNLYGLNIAKNFIACDKTVFIVEGYIDCIMMHEAGYSNTVATLGTSLTEEQIKFLRGFAEKFYLIFDGDEAGKKAALRAVDIFLNLGISPYIVSLPEGEDPDTLIVNGKKEILEKAIASAKKGVDFLVNFYYNKLSLQTSDGLRSFINSLGMHVQNIENPIEKELIIREISQITGIQFDKISQVFYPQKDERPLTEEKVNRHIMAYDYVTAFVLHKPDYCRYIDENIMQCLPLTHREVIEKVVFLKKEDELSCEAKGLFTRLSIQPPVDSDVSESVFFDNIRFIKLKKINDEKSKLNDLIREEEKSANPDYNKISLLQRQKKDLVVLEKQLLEKGVKRLYEI